MFSCFVYGNNAKIGGEKIMRLRLFFILSFVHIIIFIPLLGHAQQVPKVPKEPKVEPYSGMIQLENQWQDIQKYLSANCFGDYYTRKGLDIKTRELLTFSMLIAMGGCEPQAKGHIMANLNVGNDKQLLLTVVTNLLPYLGYPRTLSAISYLNEMIPESK